MLKIRQGRRDFLIALVGRMVSAFGDGVALVALTLRLQADGAHPYEVGLMLAAGVAPRILLARRIGQLADTHDSRRLLLVGGLIEVITTIPLIFLHAVAPIVALIAVLGVASSLTGATWAALVPRIVGEDQLAEAVSTQQSVNVLALVAAPAAGGLLAGAFGTGLPIALDAASFVVVTIAAVLVRTRRVPEQISAGDAPALRSGFDIIRADRVLTPLFVGVALVVLLVGMVDVVLVYLVRVTLQAGGVWYGVAEASWTAGMVGGAVGAGLIRTDRGRVRTTVAGIAIACAGVAAFAVAPAVWILVPISILGGIGNGYAGTCLSTLLLTRTPDSARGRVVAAANAILGGAQGVSLLLGGAVAIVLSPRAIYAVGGLLGLGAAGALAVMHESPEAGARRTTESVSAG